jgi:hypothetical protein
MVQWPAKDGDGVDRQACVAQQRRAAEVRQVDDRRAFDDDRAEPLQQVASRHHRAAGRDQVVHDDHAVAGRHASSWISTVALPYSRSYDSEHVLYGSLPTLRIGTKPTLSS